MFFPLSSISAFILVIVIGMEDGLAKNKSSSQISQKKSTRSLFMARYKRLSTQQKLRLYNVMISTMAALERSYYGRSRSSSAFPSFWDIWLTRAYAQSSSSCFYGGHIINDCNWSQARRRYNTCQVNGVTGVRCNSNILLSEGICVYTMEYARRQGLRNYSTTQACVYADTQITVQHLEGRNPGFTNNQIVRQQLNPNPDFDGLYELLIL